MPDQKFQNIIIGAGPAGTQAALRLARHGQGAALIDVSADAVGGTCLNEGCIPVKTYVQAADVYTTVARSQDFGISCGAFSVSLSVISALAAKNRDTLRSGLLSVLKNAGVTLISGTASFEDDKTLRVSNDGGHTLVTGDRILVATGSSVKTVPGLEPDGRTILTSREMLALPSVPQKLLVIGGGAIGCEFASIFRQLGSAVTILEILPQLLPAEDEEASRTLAREFQKRGMEVFCGAKVLKLTPHGPDVQAVFLADGEEQSRRYDCVLVAAGRTPRTHNLGLEKIGVAMKNGYIAVDANMRTNLPHIFAAGDVTENTAAYAHTAARGGIIAADAMAGREPEFRIIRTNIPRIVFTDPQVASVGLGETAAREAGLSAVSHKRFFKAVGKAVIDRKDAGFAKITVDGKNGKILGAVIVGPQATELIHEIGLAIEADLTLSAAGRLVHGHPTLSEVIGDITSGAQE